MSLSERPDAVPPRSFPQIGLDVLNPVIAAPVTWKK
jgi:hypothetical protein